MLQRLIFGITLTFSTVIVAFWLAWVLLIPFNFGYSAAYTSLAIDKHIAQFGPQNQFKPDFEKTDRAQHESLFGAIVTAVNAGGKGLAQIQYQLPDGSHHTLLREPEVVHLQDVANLIAKFKYTAWICSGLLIGAVVLMLRTRLQPPKLRQISLGLLVCLVLVGLVMLELGPTYVFYWLHIKIFPDNHQWFFFYQESLMTTLMKAPDLFGFIAALWTALALLLVALMQWCLHHWFRNPSKKASA